MSSNKDIASNGLKELEEHSIEALFITYKTPIYEFVYRYCQDQQLSIDIVQDTFVRFYKYQKHYDKEKSSIKTYLFRMAYQLMINRLKKRSRMKKLLPFLYQQQQQQRLSHEDILSVQAAIQQLTEEQRAVVLLTYYHDLAQRDISKILAIPVGTVKSRLHVALKKLKDLLEVNA
ncbi:RNA polymerase sigma factor [Virgibacillus oceani]